MTGKRAVCIVAVGFLLALVAGLTLAQGSQPRGGQALESAVGTAFTYQGLLRQAGTPVDVACDFQFSLWDAGSGSGQIGDTLSRSNVAVSKGLFTIPDLDFGPGAFQGDARYLEIAVHCAGDPPGYTPLTPRQALTPAPYALALPGLWTQQNVTSTNLIGGYGGNWVSDGVYGATISGGGISGSPNRVTDLGSTVGGGEGNQAGSDNGWPNDSPFSTVAGGTGNLAWGKLSAVGGGCDNAAMYSCTTIGGGCGNTADGNFSTVAGGNENSATGEASAVGGGLGNTASGQYTFIGGGRANVVSVDFGTIAGGGPTEWDNPATANRVTDLRGTVGGGGNNQAGDGDANGGNAVGATVAGGEGNTASAPAATVGGGVLNTAGAQQATVGGGGANTVGGSGATVAGGTANNASGETATIGGGANNTASDPQATVSGGGNNVAAGTHATVAGGADNVAVGNDAAICGGRLNTASNESSTVGGGMQNTSSGERATVGGGELNTASGFYATIGGGFLNVITGLRSTIGGGESNTASGRWAAIGGGWDNAAYGDSATVGGGISNTVSLFGSTVGGGNRNTASGDRATVGGGDINTASGNTATVGGGASNIASGQLATVPGGGGNRAEGDRSFAAGFRAVAQHLGSFVWGDVTDADVTSSGDNQFIVRANGGLWFGQASTAITPTIGAGVFVSTSTGAYLSTGGTWTNASDRNAKDNLAPVDGQDILARLAQVPVTTWNYTSQDPSIRHIGPMAQDYYAAFGVGEDERHISTVDADGVALAAIQGLYEQNQALTAENAAQQAQIDALEARLAALEEGGQRAPTRGAATPTGWLLLGGGLVAAAVVVGRSRRGGER